jgi:hypothetical protein
VFRLLRQLLFSYLIVCCLLCKHINYLISLTFCISAEAEAHHSKADDELQGPLPVLSLRRRFPIYK